MFSKVDQSTASQSKFEGRLEKQLSDIESGKILIARESTIFLKTIIVGFLYIGEILKGRG